MIICIYEQVYFESNDLEFLGPCDLENLISKELVS